MRKPSNFNVGDIVFAKVRDKQPWPARILAENGIQYKVKFYGTGYIEMIKVEDISDYLENKDKFQKALENIGYADAFEEMEEVISQDVQDEDSSDDSVSDDNIVRMLGTLTEMTKIMRERSVSDESTSGQHVQSPRKRPSISDEDDGDVSAEEPSPPKKSKANATEPQKSKDLEFVPINGVGSVLDRDGLDMIDINKRSKPIDFFLNLVSLQDLVENIAHANRIKDQESIYKGRPVRPREDSICQILPVKLPSGTMGGIKLHAEWPLKYENEYDRAMYDKSAAVRVLEDKQKIESGNTSVLRDAQLFFPDYKSYVDDELNKEINDKITEILRLGWRANTIYMQIDLTSKGIAARRAALAMSQRDLEWCTRMHNKLVWLSEGK